jgi:sugar phosphate permease
MGMVTAIIDGTGSLGACVTGVAISEIQSRFGWDGVFVVLMVAASGSSLLLVRLVKKELCPPAPQAQSAAYESLPSAVET